MPMRPPRFISRNRATAFACDRSRVCVAFTARPKSFRPGAWMPSAYPRYAVHHGSLWVIQCFTRSPSAWNTTAAYSA